MAKSSNIVLEIFLLCSIFFIVRGNEENLVVATKSGPVLGSKKYTIAQNKTYYAYQGIPYAKPPVGTLRFSAPVPAPTWSGILNATADGAKCTQNLVEGSENCLFISVYTPTLNSSRLLPVMVWIYGGYFLQGEADVTSFGPDYFLEEDVIVVTFNYRLGILGFLSTNDDAATGNWALKDQILALTWVQSNIKSFGGDSNIVTLFGQSAGSACVSYLVQTPLTKNLFQKAILQSGSSLDLWALSRNPRESAFNVGKALGIFTSNSTYLIERLRKVDHKFLGAVSTAVDAGETVLTNPLQGLVFAPSLEPAHKGAVIQNKSHELLRNGGYHKIPMMVGFTSQEAIPMAKILEALRIYLVTYDIFPQRLIPVDLNLNTTFSRRQNVASQIKTHYYEGLPVAVTNEKLTQFITDDQFVRGINEAVRLMSKEATVYYYRFSYRGDLGLEAGSSARNVPGVGHAEELNYLWRRSQNIKNPSAADVLTRKRLVKLWTNFAKTSNPTPEKQSILQNVTWDTTKSENQQYLDIGNDLKMRNDLSNYSIAWWNGLYEKYGTPPFDTY